MVSLYVCDIPQHVEKTDIDNLFSDIGGFVEARLVRDKNKEKIAFVDYKDEESAQFALNTLKGFRFSGSNKGLTIRFSENSKGGTVPRRPNDNPQYGNRTHEHRPRQHHSQQVPQIPQFNAQPTVSPTNIPPNFQTQNLGASVPPMNLGAISEAELKTMTEMLINTGLFGPEFTQALIGGADPKNAPFRPQSDTLQPDLQAMNNNSLSSNQNQHANKRPPQPQPITQSSKSGDNMDGINEILKSLTSGNQQIPVPAVGAYSAPQYPHPQPYQQRPKYPPPTHMPPQQRPAVSSGMPTSPNVSMDAITNLLSFSSLFQNILPLPKNATNTVYVEGIPSDAAEREVAHIFRPFPGFKSARLIPRETKNNEKVIFCFADFETPLQATTVINTLQGYRFDKDDILGLQFSYAVNNNKRGRHHDE